MSVETQFRIHNDSESYPPLHPYPIQNGGLQQESPVQKDFPENNFQTIKPLNGGDNSNEDKPVEPVTPTANERRNSQGQDTPDLPGGRDLVKQASPSSYSDCYTSDSSCAATPMKWDPSSPSTPVGTSYNSILPFSFQSVEKHVESYVPRKDQNGMDLYFCHLCSYTGTSRDSFAQHMNTHFEHSCPHCDYTSRTEGRLKRHIKDFHSPTPPENYSGNKTPKAMPGRPKVYRCKQCEFVATEKLDFWAHARSHIKEDKLLQCPKCPFVTEYKHHLEYHLRNHFGSKPFKCTKCNYACVNKSMLNSHMKSHTNVYQYRCADCTYATKYCHSLKLHLRKYNHKPATVLNSDGSLPQGLDAEAAGLSLMMKRGPPRGPRGPRKDKLEAYLGHLMSMPHLGPRPALNGLISPYWPLLGQFPNGFHPPPPLIPVSSPGGGMLNPVPQQTPSRSGSVPNREGLTLKCTFCCFTTEDKDDLTGHMLKVHAAENQDLFKAYGISSDSLLDGQGTQPKSDMEQSSDTGLSKIAEPRARPPSNPVQPVSATESLHITTDTADEVTKSSPRSWPPASSDTMEKETMNSCKSMPELFYLNGEKSPKASAEFSSEGDTSDILRQMTLKFGGNVPAPVKENKECPLDLTKPKSLAAAEYYAVNKRTYDRMLSEERPAETEANVESLGHSEATSPSPRKRSRKGKAYKLDTISWKLQGLPSETEVVHQDETGSIGSHDDGDDLGDNSDQYSEKEMDLSEHGSGRKGEVSPRIVNAETDGRSFPGERMPALREIGERRDHTFVGRDLEQLHHSLKILNENEDRKDGLHGEDRCPSPVSDLRRCSMGSNMGIPDLPVIRKGGYRSPEVNDQQSFKTGYPSKPQVATAAVRKGEEIAWKILHPDHPPTSSFQNGLVPQNIETIDSRLALPQANHYPGMSARLPTSQKLPAKVNGFNGSVHAASNGKKTGRQGSEKYECNYCEIAFRDCVMYTMHMGYHGYQDPYKCNMCGHQSRDKVDFFLHIARAAHA